MFFCVNCFRHLIGTKEKSINIKLKFRYWFWIQIKISKNSFYSFSKNEDSYYNINKTNDGTHNIWNTERTYIILKMKACGKGRFEQTLANITVTYLQ